MYIYFSDKVFLPVKRNFCIRLRKINFIREKILMAIYFSVKVKEKNKTASFHTSNSRHLRAAAIAIILSALLSGAIADVEMTFPMTGDPAATGPCRITNRQTGYIWNNHSFVVAAFGFSTTSSITLPTDATRLILGTDIDGLTMYRFSSNKQTVVIHPGETTSRMPMADNISMNLSGNAKYPRYPHVVLREEPKCYKGMEYPDTELYAPHLTSANIDAATGAVIGQADYYSAAAWYARDSAPLLVEGTGAARQHPTQLWVGIFDMLPGAICMDAVSPADYSGSPTVRQAPGSALGYWFAPNSPTGQGVYYSHTSGSGPGGLMWAMSCAWGQEILGYDMRYPFAIGCQETGLGLFYDGNGGTTNWQWTSAVGADGSGDGQYQMIDADCWMSISSFPDYFNLPNAYADSPGIVGGFRSNPVISGLANLFDASTRYYGYFSASRALRIREFTDAATDPYALVKITAVGFNVGPHAAQIQSLRCGGAARTPALSEKNLCDPASGSVTPIMGYNYYAARIPDLMRRIGTSPNVYDWGITWGDVQDYMNDMRSTFYTNGTPSNAEWTLMVNDLQAAFNKMKGKVPAGQWPTGYNANTVSYRYNWLTMLRIMKTYLPNSRMQYPKSNMFNEVDFIDQYVPTGGEETAGLCVASNTAPEIYWISPRHKMPTTEQAFPVIPDMCSNTAFVITTDVLDNDINNVTLRYAVSPGDPSTAAGGSQWLDGMKTGGSYSLPVATDWVNMTASGASVSPAGGKRFTASFNPAGITGNRRIYIEANDNCGWRTISWVDVQFVDCSLFTPTPTPCTPNVSLTKGHDPINCFPNAASVSGITGFTGVNVSWVSGPSQTSDSVGALKADLTAALWSGYIVSIPVTEGNLNGYATIRMRIWNQTSSPIDIGLFAGAFNPYTPQISTGNVTVPGSMSGFQEFTWTLQNQASAARVVLKPASYPTGTGAILIDEISMDSLYDPRCCPPLLATNSPTQTATATRTNTATATPTSTSSPTPTYTLTPSQTNTLSPSATATNTATASNSPTATPTFTGTFTRTYTPSSTETGTPLPTWTSTFTPTNSSTFTASATATSTFTFTGTFTPTFTASNTETGTPLPTWTYTNSATASSTGTPTWTPTATPTFTNSFTATATMSATNTFTHTSTQSPSFTATDTATRTPTATYTASFTRTATPTWTMTFTATATRTATATATQTATPLPVAADLSITLSATGDTPAPGAVVEYTLTIKNEGSVAASNLAVWDSLPSNLEYKSTAVGPQPLITGNTLFWKLGAESVMPGEVRIIRFTAVIISVPGGLPIANTASVDYNDQRYKEPDRHPVVDSKISFYPAKIPIIYPNPYNRLTAHSGNLKITNVVPGSVVSILTVAGEQVWAARAADTTIYWDGKNRAGSIAAAGVYFWVVRSPDNKVYKGKLFITGE